MRRRTRAPALPCAIGLVLATLAPGVARAGNDDEVFLGNQAILVGGAVTATVDDGASLIYEPSGLAEGQDDTIDVSVTAIALRAHRADDLLSASSGERTDARFVEFVTIPSTLAYTRSLSSRIRVGFGAFAVRGSAIRIRETLDVPGVGERSDYRISALQRGSTLIAAAGLGIRTSRTVRFGVSISGVYDSDDSTSLVGASRSVDDGAGGQRSTDAWAIQSVASYSRVGLRATVGLRYVPNDRFRFAVSLTSPGLAVAGLVSASASVDAYSIRPVVPYTQHAADDANGFTFRAGTFSPFRMRAGFAVRVGRATITADADLQTPVHDSSYGVDRKVVFNARVGARVTFSDTLALGAGFFTDRSGITPADDSTVGGGEDRDFYGVSLGLERVKVRRLAEGEDAPQLRFVSTYALRYAFAVGNTSGLLVPASFDATRGDQLLGRGVSSVSHELTLYVGSSLRF